MILIYSTHKNKEEAEKIVKHLLEKKLIACANFFPIESSYLWKGEIESGKEYVSLLKTQEKLWGEVKREIEQIHPYETPCILKMNVEANYSFDKWIQEETQ
ncbi:MAG: divalent-cation tolerance protein CutA [bacterium]|nr:divalent-cation tolerance protein CutA [bacterium]